MHGLVCIESHEAYPMVVVGTAEGSVIILDITDTSNVSVLAKYNLTSTMISRLKLIPNSNYLYATDDQSYHFLIKRERNSAANEDDIKKIMSVPSDFGDFSAIDSNDGSLHVLLLYTRSNQNELSVKNVSNCFAEHIQIQTASDYCHQTQTIPLNAPYNAMQFQYYDANRFVLAAKSTDIHLLELIPNGESGKMELKLMQTIATTHLAGYSIRLTVNSASILTFGGDGQCLLWDKNSMRMVKSVLAHTAGARGLKDAVLDSMQRYRCSTNLYIF